MKIATPLKKPRSLRYRRPPGRRSGVTLIELLIVVAIIVTIVPATVEFHSRIQAAAQRGAGKHEARIVAAEMLRFWREDVAMSAEVRILSEGKVMEIVRPGETGADLEIRYELDESGVIMRRLRSEGSPEVARPLARGAAGLRFESVGRGYRVDWVQEYRDGIYPLKWPGGGFAAPLSLGKEGGS